MNSSPPVVDWRRMVSRHVIEIALVERPNCLNFKTINNKKRFEVLEMLKDINISLSKLVCLAEIKSRGSDITCKKGEYVLERAGKLKEVTSAHNLRLYETENINVILGWVPIPMTIYKKNLKM